MSFAQINPESPKDPLTRIAEAVEAYAVKTNALMDLFDHPEKIADVVNKALAEINRVQGEAAKKRHEEWLKEHPELEAGGRCPMCGGLTTCEGDM